MDRIRQLRRERGLSQVKLAVMADMDPATLNRLERGTGNPNLKTLERVADALGVEVADFFPKGRRSSPEPTLLNGLGDERHASSVFADALITTAEWLASAEPPQSLADVLKRFGILDVLYSIAEPLDEIANAPARWERLSLDERMEIARAALALHDTARRVLEQNNEYLERRHEDREANREAAAMREKMRAWNQRRSA
jgi:transcriptional regulator with XRE-family HTH domain